MITCPCDLYPLTPHFYIVKLGCTGVYIFMPPTLNVDGAYCFWSVRALVGAWVRGCVGGSHFLYLL